MIKIGLGVDIHSFEEGRRCVLGGVHIPHPRGLKGHSDADALAHAVMDALLGALGERDIGHFFPDTDDAWKNADSLKMLAMVGEVLERKKAVIHNMDVTVIAQEPKLAPHVAEMKQNLARTLKIRPEQVGIKATSSEWMGFTGRKEGVVALAAACVDCP
ncbi:MAG: 2-C-methyl-D-erythritol 2,4-cyclodiphosphate synthase [Verrucomicrobia bacterium]|nr:2-C-methyl-D-erythritol 2,4-cyclodiphosphate synthase [Verrucomicrobiota bacterium]